MIPQAAAAFLLAAGAVQADGLDLTAQARTSFGDEVRALLLDEPALVADAIGPTAPFIPDAASIYAYEAARDREALAAQDELFATTPFGFGAAMPERTLVLFLSAPCPDCARALAEARTLAAEHPGLRVELRAADASPDTAQAIRAAVGAEGTPPGADAFTRLDLDTAPAYVLPGLMLRGWIPAVVLSGYLE